MPNAFKFNSIAQLKAVNGSRRYTENKYYIGLFESEIRKHMDSLHISTGMFEMPTWEAGFRTGKKLNVGQFLSGVEKCMERRHMVPDGSSLSGRRIVCQLALLANSNADTVFRRAIASMALASKLLELGENVELLFCWQSTTHESQWREAKTIYTEASGLGIRQIATMMVPEFFRTLIMNFRADRGPNGHLGFADGGAGSTVESFPQFKQNCEEQQIVRNGDILLDWNLPIKQQIEVGLSLIGG